MELIIKENIAKNIILLILFVILYAPIENYLVNTELLSNKPLAGDVLVAVSLFAVIACFGCFTFSYEKINPKSSFERYLSHITTGVYMLVIGMALIFTKVLLMFLMWGAFLLVDLMFVLLYIAVVGFDFWDLFKITHQK